MMDPVEWLGTWEPIPCAGRHCKTYPAPFAHGYQWRGPEMSRQPRPGRGDPRRSHVQRAIPVDGSVTEPAPSWSKSPQARFWLEEKRPSVGARLRAWLKGAAR